jgi:phosphoenolpyruvate carboxykinase (GTP)
LDIDADDLAAALRVDPDEWRAELPQITEWFHRFGDKLPAVLWTELDGLRGRLNRITMGYVDLAK